MRILVINPNSSQRMTADIAATAKAAAPASVEVDVVRMPESPEVLESFADYTLAAAQMMGFVADSGAAGYDGVLVACFGDPGLYAMKELLDVPCIGIAEASLSRALLLGSRFSIIAASTKARPMMESLVDTYGLQARNAGTLTLNAPIESFLGNPQKLAALISNVLDAAESASDVLIYGCAGMTALTATELERERGLAVIDPVACGVSTLASLINDGAHTSRAGLYAKAAGN